MPRFLQSLPKMSLLLGLGLVASACTAILVPDADDDGVDRCNTSEDCPAPGDTRYQAACVFGADQDEGSDKVCTTVYNVEVNCISEAFDMTHPYRMAWDDAQDSQAYNEICAEEDLGQEGCGRDLNGQCNDGLEFSETYSTCVDPDKLLKAVSVPLSGEGFEAGFDVNDQICRYHFCDERFVCNQSTGKCEICTEGETMENGGCVELYTAGARSTVYLSEEHGECGDVKGGESMIGDVP
jgi:hypothetical protein